MKKYLLILIGLILLNACKAADTHFEIYGVDPIIQNKILDCCKNNINQYIELDLAFNYESLKLSDKVESMDNELHKLRDSILKKIYTIDDFSLVEFSNVYYPDTDSLFVTLDIVKKSDSFRMPVSPQRQIIKNMKKSPGLNHLFTLFNEFKNKNYSELRSHPYADKPCHFAHCTFGFDATQKNYESQFKEGAIKYQTELKAVIEHSNNDSDRKNAIFLLAHSDDYIELAHYLIQYTNDSSSSVRNNTMRVMGAILAKHLIKNLDIKSFLLALNYPLVTDRNKALYSLYGIVQNDKSSHSIVIQKSGQTLLNLLKLQQPNNHEIAYLILKEISKQNYSARDYQSWKKWIEARQNKIRV